VIKTAVAFDKQYQKIKTVILRSFVILGKTYPLPPKGSIDNSK
jgi:hypothetical protein